MYSAEHSFRSSDYSALPSVPSTIPSTRYMYLTIPAFPFAVFTNHTSCTQIQCPIPAPFHHHHKPIPVPSIAFWQSRLLHQSAGLAGTCPVPPSSPYRRRHRHRHRRRRSGPSPMRTPGSRVHQCRYCTATTPSRTLSGYRLRLHHYRPTAPSPTHDVTRSSGLDGRKRADWRR